jgi:capsular polysaccharide biosynthesis protein
MKRHFWIIALIVGVVALYSAYQYYHLYKTPGALKAYQSTITLRIGLAASTQSTNPNYADYLSASETLSDAFVNGPVLNSKEFATQVSQQIQADTDQITRRYGANADLGNVQDVGAIGSALSATRAHNLVTVNVLWSTPAGAWAIANAVGEVSAAHISSYLDYEVRNTSSSSLTENGTQPLASAQVINTSTDPTLVPGPSANKPQLLIALLFVALIIGIALAFLIEYLDDRVHSAAEVAQLLQLPIYGEVPRAPSAGRNIARRTH